MCNLGRDESVTGDNDGVTLRNYWLGTMIVYSVPVAQSRVRACKMTTHTRTILCTIFC